MARLQAVHATKKDLVEVGRGTPIEELAVRYHVLAAQIWQQPK